MHTPNQLEIKDHPLLVLIRLRREGILTREDEDQEFHRTIVDKELLGIILGDIPDDFGDNAPIEPHKVDVWTEPPPVAPVNIPPPAPIVETGEGTSMKLLRSGVQQGPPIVKPPKPLQAQDEVGRDWLY